MRLVFKTGLFLYNSYANKMWKIALDICKIKNILYTDVELNCEKKVH